MQTFENPTPATEDRFGISVAAIGGNVLIGANGDDTGATNTGAAYLFNGSTGELLGTILNPEPDAYDRFGYSVAFAGNDILVGAFGDGASGVSAGTAYLFQGPAPIPEPATILLLGSGIAGLAGVRRRRSANS